MKQVDFDYVDFKKYLQLQERIEELNQMDLTNKELLLIELNQLRSELPRFEKNLSLFHNLITKSPGFAKTAHFELKKRKPRVRQPKLEESYIIDLNESDDEDYEKPFVYETGDMVRVCDCRAEAPYCDGDRLIIQSREFKGGWIYIAKHADKESDITFIVTHEELC
jgi:hypothetical protein